MSTVERALVTGCSGFVGRVLCSQLRARGCRVLGLARRETHGPWDELLVHDLADDAPPAGRLAVIDTVFHLAAHAHAEDSPDGDDTPYRRINVEGTRHLLGAAAEAGVDRIVYASSVKAMGEGGATRLDESVAPAPDSAYGRTKLIAEREVLAFGAARGAHASVVRFPLLYGPGVKGNLARLVAAIDAGRFPPLPAVANRRSMLHVEDAAGALLACAEKPAAAGRVFIVTDGVDYSSRDIIDSVRAALGRRAPRYTLPWWSLALLARIADGVTWLTRRPLPFGSAALQRLYGSACYDARQITQTLGFRPRHTLQTALPEMVARYRAGLVAPTDGGGTA